MLKHIIFAIIFIALTSSTFALEIEKAPKHKSLEIGQRYLSSNTFDMKNMGTTILFDYAWQLSGFTGKPAGYISVPLGYTFFFAGDGKNTGGILSYGWTVRHDLKSNQKTIPFFGYGLLLNQLRLENIEGSVFGHQTRFDFGYEFNSDKKLSQYIKVEYSFTRYPRWGDKESDRMHAFELKGGVRF